MKKATFIITSEAIPNYKEEISLNIDEIIEDIYINRFDARVLINYGKKDCDIRVISMEKWDEKDEKSTENINRYLVQNSELININNIQIQEMLQHIHSITINKEQQIYIYLDRELGEVRAILGPEGTNREAEINSYSMFFESSKRKEETPPLINVGEVRGGLLGQVHTHPKIEDKNLDNTYGTSTLDKNTATSLDINIYSLDSWNHYSKNARVTINRVTPTGIETKNVGKTYGKKDKKTGKINLEGTINIGLECLNLRVGRK